MIKKRVTIIVTIVLILIFTTTAYAHNGKLDAEGGHADKNNLSGLGDYHYHCGDKIAHLHPNGVCPYDENVVMPKAIDMENREPTMLKGEIRDAKAKVTPENAFDVPHIWSSNNEQVVKIEDGKLHAVGVGEALITAAAFNGKKDLLLVRVLPSVEQINMDKPQLSLKPGEKVKVVAQIYPTNAVNRNIVWTTGDPKVATVENGTIRAIGGGQTIISAVSDNDVRGTVEVKVTDEILSIELCEKRVSIRVGEARAVFYTTKPPTATSDTITWLSSNERVAYVQNGNIIGNGFGKCKVRIMADNGVSATIDVYVGPSPILIIGFVIFVCALVIFIIKTNAFSRFKRVDEWEGDDYYEDV